MAQPCASYAHTAILRPRSMDTQQARLIEELKDLQAARRWNQSSAASSATGSSRQLLKQAQLSLSLLTSSSEDFYLGAVSVSPVWDSQTSMGDTTVLDIPTTAALHHIEDTPSTSRAAAWTQSMPRYGASDTSGPDEEGGGYAASGKDQFTMKSITWMQRVCMFALLLTTTIMAGSAAMAMIYVNKGAASPADTFSAMPIKQREIFTPIPWSTPPKIFAGSPSIQASSKPRYFDGAREVPRHHWNVGVVGKEYEPMEQIPRRDSPRHSTLGLDDYPREETAEYSLKTPQSKNSTIQP